MNRRMDQSVLCSIRRVTARAANTMAAAGVDAAEHGRGFAGNDEADE